MSSRMQDRRKALFEIVEALSAGKTSLKEANVALEQCKDDAKLIKTEINSMKKLVRRL